MIDGRRTIDRVLEAIANMNLPSAYFKFDKKVVPPFVVYYGSGQIKRSADNTHYWSHNLYTIEYYFNDKDVEAEDALEEAMLESGFQFEKSEDVYLDDEDVFVIYYYLN